MFGDRLGQRRVHRRSARAVGLMLDARVPAMLSASGAAGVSVAVSVGGARVSRAYGLADIAERRPMTDQTMFRVASITKSVSAFGIVHLHHAGVIDLDEPVTRYLRSWSFGTDEPNTEGVTLRRIFSHTAGLGVHHYGVIPAMDPEPGTAQVLSGACGEGTAVGLVTEPGKSAFYSSGAYTLAQMAVEDVTGKSFAACMHEAVFGPLGMRDSGYGSSTESMAIGHDHDGRVVGRSFLPAASSGLCSTPTDLIRFWEALLPGPHGEPPGRGIITPESAQEMLRQQATEPDGPTWGMGFCIGSNRLGETYQHAGWTGGEWAFAMGNARHRITMAIAINSMTGRDWGKEVVREIVGVLC